MGKRRISKTPRILTTNLVAQDRGELPSKIHHSGHHDQLRLRVVAGQQVSTHRGWKTIRSPHRRNEERRHFNFEQFGELPGPAICKK